MNLELFLCENEYINYSSQNIIEKSKELFSDEYSAYDKAKIAFEFVRDEIPHSSTIPNAKVTSNASSVLMYKTGICHAKSNLLAALLRSQGIPTGFCYQHLTCSEDDSNGYCLHCFNAIYINNNWIKVDANGNKNAQFSVNKPILSFKNRPEYDEYFFNGIWANPDMRTMKFLKTKEIKFPLIGFPEFPEAEPDII